MKASIGGLFAALDIGVFLELPDRRFEPAAELPAWCRAFVGRADGPVALDEKFLFLESFLADARGHWARRSIEALRSGPWTECDQAGVERRLQASALFFAERATLLIESLGEEFDRVQKILQRARETTLAHQRLSLLTAALETADRDTRQALAAHPDLMFRVRSDGSCRDFSGRAGGLALDPREILGDAAARVLVERARRSLAIGAPLARETTVEAGARERWIETRIAPCGPDEALVLVRDVTERKAAEEEIERRLNRLRSARDDLLSILDEIGVAALVMGADGRCVFATEAARKLLPPGGDERDLPSLDPAFERDLAETAAKPASLREPLRWRSRDPGDARIVEAEIRDDPREPRRRVVFLRDVTEVESLRRKLDERERFGELIGNSAPMREVYRLIEQFAASDATVLIEGATGSGKELVARALHDRGARSGRPFVAVNCAGLTESLAAGLLFGHKRGSFTGALHDQKGFFEAADSGTLFLDEVGDLPNTVQTALLRALQEREVLRIGETAPRKVDVRLVCATHRDLGVCRG